MYKMLRLVLRQCSSWRSIYLSVNRLKQHEQSVSVSKILQKSTLLDAVTVDKIDLEPPVYEKPLTLLEEKDSQTSESSEIGEFVDNLGPPLPISFNLAAYVNRSETLQNLVRLGVDLSELEKKPDRAKFILQLDFDKDIKKHIQFLHDHGVEADNLGKFITKNPFIFKEDIKNLEIRINYLKSKKFNQEAIVRILNANPFFLSLETKAVDERLGFLQKQFSLTGEEVRYLATKSPKLISYSFAKFREKLFIFKEVLGYDSKEMKEFLLDKPKLWILSPKSLRERFYVLHNFMGLSHETILKNPISLTRRSFIVKQRHEYLVHLKRAQYDPTSPLYVSLHDLVTLSDSEFCEKCAKTSVHQYNAFLKTL